MLWSRASDLENQQFARHLHPLSISTSWPGGTCHSPAPRPRAPRCLSPSGPACLWGLIHSVPLYSRHSCHQSASNQAAHFCGMIQAVLSSLCWQDALRRGRPPPLEPQLTLHGSLQNSGPPEAVFDDAPGPHRTGLDCPFSGPLGVLNVETRVPLSAYASAPASPRGFLGFLKRYSLGS